MPIHNNPIRIILIRSDLFLFICRRIIKTINPVITRRINASKFFSTSNVATTNVPIENPIIRTADDKPSRYITIKNESYTSARPVSLCIMLKTAGNKAMPAAISCACVRLKSVSGLERYFANARHTQILQNSAG